MARTLTVIGEVSHILGDLRARIIEMDVTSYAAGGESITAAELGMSRIDKIDGENVGVGAGPRDAYLVRDLVNSKMMVFVASTGLEKAAAATATFRLIVLGK